MCVCVFVDAKKKKVIVHSIGALSSVTGVMHTVLKTILFYFKKKNHLKILGAATTSPSPMCVCACVCEYYYLYIYMYVCTTNYILIIYICYNVAELCVFALLIIYI
jgi:hypothetical protein